ncbi:MAG: hypothetical protein A2493_03795 [Candidatus Magasanikbacteria bacterium RIFOXYC12_FULL_33_11]|uniref:PsbP C-terminal domain-containing protein n=1 Tax=Candidatus Magasanikbacteria bacterium RIFOXYC12_FULL_33_11 TaxID=1798701 RepID=A0A1F6NMA2_9BACT|nr:MAG: hypothetical protein A2493_03795 [Candidatus Magasanikbacteria bacterium RIFOXYC12_FULL_33_11]
MKKSNLSLLVVAFSMLFVGAGCSYEASVGEVKDLPLPVREVKEVTVADKSGNFNISGTIAEDWVEDKEADPRVLTMFLSPTSETDTFRESINVMGFLFAEGEAEMTLDENVDSSLTGLDQDPGYKFLSRTSGTIGGYPAITVVYQVDSATARRRVQFEQTFFKTEKEFYMVTFAATPESAVEFEQDYQDFLKSISVK